MLFSQHIVHNDFHDNHGLFTLFDGLSVPGIDTAFEGEAEAQVEEPKAPKINGVQGIISHIKENLPLTNEALASV
jgi:hypothetical protein